MHRRTGGGAVSSEKKPKCVRILMDWQSISQLERYVWKIARRAAEGGARATIGARATTEAAMNTQERRAKVARVA